MTKLMAGAFFTRSELRRQWRFQALRDLTPSPGANCAGTYPFPCGVGGRDFRHGATPIAGWHLHPAKEETTDVSLLDELEETALRSRLEFFLAVHGVKPAHLAKEASISRQHLLRVRKGLMEPTRWKIAQIISALRRLTFLDVQPSEIFELSVWALAGVRDEAASAGRRFRALMRSTTFRIAQVLQKPESEWAAGFAKHPVSEALVRQLVLTAHRSLDDKPQRAIAIHALAERLALSMPRFVNPNLRIALIGRTSLDRATAFRQLGRLPQAAQMLDRAEELFRSTPYCTHELAQAWYERAAVHFRLGEDDAAAVLTRQARGVFVLAGDRRRAAKARMIEACILVDRRQFAQARDAFRDSLPTFKAYGDQEALASAHLNLGSTEMHLGHFAAARSALGAAVTEFTKLGMRGEVVRARWNLAHLAAFHTDRESGLRLLRQARADFANLGMTGSAASVGLDLVNALFADEGAAEEAVQLARAVFREFEKSGATKNALEALAYLRDALQRREPNGQLIEDVQTFVQRAPRYPGAVFTPQS